MSSTCRIFRRIFIRTNCAILSKFSLNNLKFRQGRLGLLFSTSPSIYCQIVSTHWLRVRRFFCFFINEFSVNHLLLPKSIILAFWWATFYITLSCNPVFVKIVRGFPQFHTFSNPSFYDGRKKRSKRKSIKQKIVALLFMALLAQYQRGLIRQSSPSMSLCRVLCGYCQLISQNRRRCRSSTFFHFVLTSP